MILFFLPDESSSIFNLLSSLHSPWLSLRDARRALSDRIDTHRKTDRTRKRSFPEKNISVDQITVHPGNFFLCLSNNKVRKKLFPTRHTRSRKNTNCNIEKINRFYDGLSQRIPACAFSHRSILYADYFRIQLAGLHQIILGGVYDETSETFTKNAPEFSASVYSRAVRNTNE